MIHSSPFECPLYGGYCFFTRGLLGCPHVYWDIHIPIGMSIQVLEGLNIAELPEIQTQCSIAAVATAWAAVNRSGGG